VDSNVFAENNVVPDDLEFCAHFILPLLTEKKSLMVSQT
jgi:hypothetical protein